MNSKAVTYAVGSCFSGSKRGISMVTQSEDAISRVEQRLQQAEQMIAMLQQTVELMLKQRELELKVAELELEVGGTSPAAFARWRAKKTGSREKSLAFTKKHGGDLTGSSGHEKRSSAGSGSNMAEDFFGPLEPHAKTVTIAVSPEFGQVMISDCRLDLTSVTEVLSLPKEQQNEDSDEFSTVSFIEFSGLVKQSTDPVAEKFLTWVSEQVKLKESKREGNPFQSLMRGVLGGLLFPQHGYVYVLRSESLGMVKIGFSKDPTKRLESIRGHIPDVTLAKQWFVKTPSSLEQKLHAEFADSRQHGEWFAGVTKDQVEAIINASGLLRCKEEIDSLVKRFEAR